MQGSAVSTGHSPEVQSVCTNHISFPCWTRPGTQLRWSVPCRPVPSRMTWLLFQMFCVEQGMEGGSDPCYCLGQQLSEAPKGCIGGVSPVLSQLSVCRQAYLLSYTDRQSHSSMCGPWEKFLVLRHAAACFSLHMWVPTLLWEIELTCKRQHSQHCWAELVLLVVSLFRLILSDWESGVLGVDC